tara:strand:+ start:101 stop:502 length:402 start_codon:yes stop_codon:yes gene_type:complete
MNETYEYLPSNRKFGFFFAAIFLILGSYFFYKDFNKLSVCFLILSILLILITFLKEDLLLPLNKLWLKLGLLLGKIISPIILGFIFFILFSPLGIIMKIFGRDVLRLKKHRRKTYWKNRKPVGPDRESFKYQF